MGFLGQPLRERCGNPGFADPGLAREQHDLAVPLLRVLPSARLKFEFLAPADERCRRGRAQRLEPACDRARPQHLPSRYHTREAARLDGAESAVFEQPANKPPRILVD